MRDRRLGVAEPVSHRCAYRGVADLSVYVARDARGTGVGSLLLRALENTAKVNAFHKIVLFTFAFNAGGQASIASSATVRSGRSASRAAWTAASWTSWRWKRSSRRRRGVYILLCENSSAAACVSSELLS